VREINDAGLELVKKWEGVEDGDPTTVNLDPYLDPVGIWTIGWGHAIRDPKTGAFLRGKGARARAFALFPGGITVAQASALVRADLLDAAARVTALTEQVPLTDNQHAALCSFEFNCGALRGSTLLKLLRAGDYAGAAEQFGRWVNGTDPKTGKKVVLRGLVSRRRDERALFLQA
jgi:lysozyme